MHRIIEIRNATVYRGETRVFDGLTRGGHPVAKTFKGDEAALMATVLPPPAADEMAVHH